MMKTGSRFADILGKGSGKYLALRVAYKTRNISETGRNRVKLTIHCYIESHTVSWLVPKCMTLNDL